MTGEAKNLIVGGTFLEESGKPSKIVAALASHMGWSVQNGGRISDLRETLEKIVPTLDALIWMPNICNDVEKLLPDIKKINPKLFLVQSKRVLEKDYTEADVIGRLLASHANMGIMLTQPAEKRYHFKLLDPLGNLWADTDDIDELGDALQTRIFCLSRLERVPSIRVGSNNFDLGLEPEFLRIIRSYGEQFSKFVNAVNPNRLLGNASTRCSKGFPSVRPPHSQYILVTRRNVDKATLSEQDFVPVSYPGACTRDVQYLGDNKPSVDTPIQMRLFDYYPNVNYMIHGHVYIKDAPTTRSKIPCGYVEEFTEIANLFPFREASNFAVNLKGHGCLILARDLAFFGQQILRARPFPER